MKSRWSIKAKNDLNRITKYVTENFSVELALHITEKLRESAVFLESYPELGRKIGDHFHKRYLIIDGNVLMYEIVLSQTPMVVIRSIRPRKEIK